jgi:hypothetical protein
MRVDDPSLTAFPANGGTHGSACVPSEAVNVALLAVWGAKNPVHTADQHDLQAKPSGYASHG